MRYKLHPLSNLRNSQVKYHKSEIRLKGQHKVPSICRHSSEIEDVKKEKRKEIGLDIRNKGSTTNHGHTDRDQTNPSLFFISRFCLHHLSFSSEASMPILSNMNSDWWWFPQSATVTILSTNRLLASALIDRTETTQLMFSDKWETIRKDNRLLSTIAPKQNSQMWISCLFIKPGFCDVGGVQAQLDTTNCLAWLV